MNLINSTNFLFIFDSIDLNSKLKKLEFIYHFHYGKKRPKKKKILVVTLHQGRQETRRPTLTLLLRIAL